MELLCKLRLDAPRPSWPDSGKDVGIGLIPDLVKGCQEYIYIYSKNCVENMKSECVGRI